MPSHRFRMPVAVYGVLSMGGNTLFMRRAGSGYHDGELALPAGHVDGGEDAVAALVRELREELLVEARPVSCQLATVIHSAPEYQGDSEYINLFFLVSDWSGRPEIGEPDQCTELVWAESARLPDVVPLVAAALAAIRTGQRFLAYGWPAPPTRPELEGRWT